VGTNLIGVCNVVFLIPNLTADILRVTVLNNNLKNLS